MCLGVWCVLRSRFGQMAGTGRGRGTHILLAPVSLDGTLVPKQLGGFLCSFCSAAHQRILFSERTNIQLLRPNRTQ